MMSEESKLRITIHLKVSSLLVDSDKKRFEMLLPQGSRVIDALRQLAEMEPGFKRRMGEELEKEDPHLPLVISIGKARTGYCDELLTEGDELTLVPAVMGG